MIDDRSVNEEYKPINYREMIEADMTFADNVSYDEVLETGNVSEIVKKNLVKEIEKDDKIFNDEINGLNLETR